MEDISAIETQVYGLNVSEAMAPPEQEEKQELRLFSAGVKKIGATLEPGKSVGFGGIKFKPLNGHHARTHASPLELMKSYGRWNIIRNINLYTINRMYKGIGTFINITA